jgi:hypothetical protein
MTEYRKQYVIQHLLNIFAGYKWSHGKYSFENVYIETFYIYMTIDTDITFDEFQEAYKSLKNIREFLYLGEED